MYIENTWKVITYLHGSCYTELGEKLRGLQAIHSQGNNNLANKLDSNRSVLQPILKENGLLSI